MYSRSVCPSRCFSHHSYSKATIRNVKAMIVSLSAAPLGVRKLALPLLIGRCSPEVWNLFLSLWD